MKSIMFVFVFSFALWNQVIISSSSVNDVKNRVQAVVDQALVDLEDTAIVNSSHGLQYVKESLHHSMTDINVELYYDIADRLHNQFQDTFSDRIDAMKEKEGEPFQLDVASRKIRIEDEVEIARCFIAAINEEVIQEGIEDRQKRNCELADIIADI